MKVVGITGGVGCGKSTVLSLLNELTSCALILADDVAKELMEPGQKCFEEVVAFFGDTVLQADGTLNRAALAQIIFENPQKRMVLNSIVHPSVKQRIVAMITEHRIANDVDYVFVEAALFFEDHYEIFCDEIWYVYADEMMRRVRLGENRGYSDEKITKMMAAQLSDTEFRERCDVLIDNGTSLEKTRTQLVELLKL